VSAEGREKVVRAYLEPYEGPDFLVPVREAIARRRTEGDAGAFASMGPAWAVVSAEIEWDVTAFVGGGAMKTVFRGRSELLDFWAEWLEVWDRYAYTVSALEHRGEWVIATIAIEAEARGGTPVEVTIGQAFAVADGMLSGVRIFPSAAEARTALDGSD